MLKDSVVSLKGLLKSIYEKSSDLSGTIVYSKYPGMLSPSRNLVSSGPDKENIDLLYSRQLKLCQIHDVMQNVLDILMSADEWCIRLPCLDTF